MGAMWFVYDLRRRFCNFKTIIYRAFVLYLVVGLSSGCDQIPGTEGARCTSQRLCAQGLSCDNDGFCRRDNFCVPEPADGCPFPDDGTCEIPDWMTGPVPTFNGLSCSGSGNLLVVNTIQILEPVDVWLVGERTPSVQGLVNLEASLMTNITSGPRRVVFTRSGTSNVVGCSDWFPLGPDEQWAVVGTLDAHACDAPLHTTVTVQQTEAEASNPVRFVHGAVAGSVVIDQGVSRLPDLLRPQMTIAGSELLECTSECEVPVVVTSSEMPTVIRKFRYRVGADLGEAQPPVAGELLMIVAGDINFHLQGSSEGLAILVVDASGRTHKLVRGHELALLAPFTRSVVFTAENRDTQDVVAVGEVERCEGQAPCALKTMQLDPGLTYEIEYTYLNDDNTEGFGRDFIPIQVDLLQAYGFYHDGELWEFWEDSLRPMGSGSEIIALNLQSSQTMTLGQLVNSSTVTPFSSFYDIPPRKLGGGAHTVPPGQWELVTSFDGMPLDNGCHFEVFTPPPFRGLLLASGEEAVMVDVGIWPPVEHRLRRVCRE